MSPASAMQEAPGRRDTRSGELRDLPPLPLLSNVQLLPVNFATFRWGSKMPALLRRVPRAPVEMLDVFALRAAATGPYLLVRYGLVLSQLPDAPVDDWSYVATLNADLDLRVRMGAPVFKELERYGFHLTWTSPL